MIKKTTFLVAMLLIAWHGYSQEQKGVTLKMEGASLKEIIEQIEQQTKYTFVYNETIDLAQKKSIDITNQNIEKALNMIFDNTNIEWKIRRNHIALTFKKSEVPLAQKVTISGYINDLESSEVLIGANIYDVLSGKGTASNEFGFFSLTLPAGEAQLRFSYTGYAAETKKMSLQKDEKINIKLNQNIQLEEIGRASCRERV